MSFTFSIPVLRANLWSEEAPGCALLSPVLSWTHGAPDVAFVEPLARRRLGKLARGMIHCAAQVDPPRSHRMVFASRHGDCERTQGLMADVAKGEPLSPAHFSVSVHNATAGLWSLLRGNQAPASSLAAGPDTFPLGLLEAAMASLQTPELPVLYVFGEDELPEVHHPFLQDCPTRHAMALLVDPTASHRLTLSLDPTVKDPAPRTQLSLEAGRAWMEGRPLAWAGPRGTWSFHAS